MVQNTETTTFSDRTSSDLVMRSLRKIIRATDINSKSLVKRIGLTGPQLLILKEITNNNALTPGKLAQALSLSQGTITGILERMERRGFLTRERDKNDKRRVNVRITEIGQQTVKDAPPLMHESFVKSFESLPKWEQMMILSALQRIVAIIEDRKTETDISQPST